MNKARDLLKYLVGFIQQVMLFPASLYIYFSVVSYGLYGSYELFNRIDLMISSPWFEIYSRVNFPRTSLKFDYGLYVNLKKVSEVLSITGIDPFIEAVFADDSCGNAPTV